MVVAPPPGGPLTPVAQPPHCAAPPTVQPSAPPIQTVPPTHPLPPPIPDVVPSSTAPPVVKPSPHPPHPPHPPAPHVQPPLPASISNEMMLKLLAANPAAWMNVLRPYKHPSSSWTNLTVAPPTPSTPPTVAGSLQSLQATPVPTPSTHPTGMPILPPSAILQHSKLSHTIGRVTARVVSPASVSHCQCVSTSPSIGLEASPVLAMGVSVGS